MFFGCCEVFDSCFRACLGRFVLFGGLGSLLLVAEVFLGLFWGIVRLSSCFGEFFVVV